MRHWSGAASFLIFAFCLDLAAAWRNKTARYAVGVHQMTYTDAVYAESSVVVVYPAARASAAAASKYNWLWAAKTDLGGDPANALFGTIKPSVRSFFSKACDPLSVVNSASCTTFEAGARTSAQLASDEVGDFPTIFFAADLGVHPIAYLSLFESLASRGFIVIAPAAPAVTYTQDENDLLASGNAGLHLLKQTILNVLFNLLPKDVSALPRNDYDGQIDATWSDIRNYVPISDKARDLPRTAPPNKAVPQIIVAGHGLGATAVAALVAERQAKVASCTGSQLCSHIFDAWGNATLKAGSVEVVAQTYNNPSDMLRSAVLLAPDTTPFGTDVDLEAMSATMACAARSPTSTDCRVHGVPGLFIAASSAPQQTGVKAAHAAWARSFTGTRTTNALGASGTWRVDGSRVAEPTVLLQGTSQSTAHRYVAGLCKLAAGTYSESWPVSEMTAWGAASQSSGTTPTYCSSSTASVLQALEDSTVRAVLDWVDALGGTRNPTTQDVTKSDPFAADSLVRPSAGSGFDAAKSNATGISTPCYPVDPCAAINGRLSKKKSNCTLKIGICAGSGSKFSCKQTWNRDGAAAAAAAAVASAAAGYLTTQTDYVVAQCMCPVDYAGNFYLLCSHWSETANSNSVVRPHKCFGSEGGEALSTVKSRTRKTCKFSSSFFNNDNAGRRVGRASFSSYAALVLAIGFIANFVDFGPGGR